MHSKRRAYTLLEVLLVVAIILVVTAVSFTPLTEMYSGVRVRAAADGVRAAWANARSWSIDDARAYRFAVIPGKGNFRVAPDAAEFWNGDSTEGTTGNVMESSLPRGIRFTTSDNPGDAGDSNTIVDTSGGAAEWVPVVTFLPDGTAAEDVEVAFQYGSARPTVLCLRGLTGTVTSVRSATP